MNTRTLFLLTLATIASVSCKNANNSDEPVPTQVQVFALKDTSCVVDFSYPATLQGLQDVAIYPQVSGRITEIKVKEGQFVNKGDVLFVIDDVPYRAAYDAAAAQVEVAKAELETAKLTCQSKQNLFDLNIISEYQLNLAKNEVTTAEAVLGQAKASLKNAENDLSFTKVRTMGKGNIGSLPYKVGSLVGPNITSPLTMVSDNSYVYADFSITENTYLELGIRPDGKNDMRDDFPLYLDTNLGERYEHEGRIHSLSGLISSSTGTIPVRALFPNPDRKLLSGGACSVIFNIKQDNQLVIPRSSMKEIQNKLFVFVVKDNALSQVAVNATKLDSKNWIILPDEEGSFPIKVGDKITKTTNRLMDGMKVTIVD